MIKAILIVASLNINTVFSDMDTCLKARLTLMEQDNTIKSLCVPITPKKVEQDPFPDNFERMMDIFLKMIDRIKEYEEIDRLNDEENRLCEGCVK